MEKEAQDLISERVKKLPKEVRDMLASDELHKKVQAIGTKHNLHIDQLGILEDEVVLVMMGFTAPGELEQQMIEQMSLPKETASALVGDINETIFLPIRAAMQKFVEQEEAGASSQNTPASEKSVVMPSSVAKQSMPSVPTTIVPSTPPAAPASKPATPVVLPVSKPAASPAIPMLSADTMLKETTVSMPKVTPPPSPAPAATSVVAPKAAIPPATNTAAPKPSTYKTDPYREPPE